MVRTLESATAILALAVALAGLDSPAAGQVSELIEVRVVNVDVTVRDRRGRPVTGLEREDFEVRVDGEEVAVVNFYADEGQPGSASPAGVPPLQSDASATLPGAEQLVARPLQLAILVDSSNVEVQARNESLERVRAFLRTNLRSGDRVMLDAKPSNVVARVRPQTFTDRLDLVEQELDGIAATATQDRRSAEFHEILQDIGTALSVGDASVRGRMRSLESRIRAFSAAASRETARTADDLRRLVDRLAGLPGRKAVLYLGGGLSLRPGEALTGALNQALGRYAALLPEGSRMPDQPAPSADNDSGTLLALARYASVRGVAFYAVTLGESTPGSTVTLSGSSVEAGSGSVPGQEESWAPTVGVSRKFDLESSLELLAGATGGRMADGRGAARLLDRLLEDAQAFYSLGIEPPGGDPGAVHRLDVRVRGRRLDVRHRETVRTRSRDQQDADRTLSALWAGAGETPEGLFTVRLATGAPTPTEKGTFSVPVSVQVPMSALTITPEDETHTGQVSVFFAAGDGLNGGPVRKAVFPINLRQSEVPEARRRMADYRLELEMPPGPGRIAVGVRDDLAPQLSIVTLDLEVEEGARPVMSPSSKTVAADVAPRPESASVPDEATDSVTESPKPADPVTRPRKDRSALARRSKERRKYRLPEEETARAYRHALSLLADDERESALAALRELETTAIGRAVYDQLEKIESRSLIELEKASPDSLLPVALLHADLLPIYRRLGLAPLSEHALRTSRRWAKSVAVRGSPAVRPAASRALTELAGVLMRAGRLSECEELFELALQADPSNAVARLGLGVSHERRGSYEEAVDALEPLAGQTPDHPEARLRLALSLERLGRTERSRPILQTLIAEPASPRRGLRETSSQREADEAQWIAQLATQESVRISLRERQLEEASSLLEAALERWPGHPGLRMQQALLLDRQRSPRRAREQVAGLVDAGAASDPNPRDRYNRWPASDTERRQLREEAGARLAELGRILDAVAP